MISDSPPTAGPASAVLSAVDRKVSARMLLIVGSLTAFGPLCIDMYLPALPQIGDDLHASASTVQLSLTSCLLGLALGQVLVGPLSDRHGRRRPLFLGLGLFIIASAACALAPSSVVLIALRFAQGLGGASGIVVAQAIVRDQYSGPAAARFFSLLMLVTGLGPILAPQIGAELLHLGSWRVMFACLALAGTVLLTLSAVRLPETLPPSQRSSGGIGPTLATMRSVAADRQFLVNALACALGSGTIFAYVAGASFVFENAYGLSPQLFSLVFAFNALGLIMGSQVNARLVVELGSVRLLTFGLFGLATGGVVLLGLVLTSSDTLVGVIACMFVVMTGLGFVGPNATALALNDFPQAAGSASALLGLLRFSVGAAVAPLVGLGGPHAVLPLAIVMAGCSVLATVLRLAFRATAAAELLEPDPAAGCPIVSG